jgi:two-component system, cell cycle response regulator DivK
MTKKVLLFEDDEQLIELLSLILRLKGYSVAHRPSCNNVLNDIKEETPDLILMDLRIPEIGGEEATKLIKQEESIRHIPVIIVSADLRIKEKATLSGADGYIVKPFEISEFENIVKDFLNS